ncbi:M14 family metallopeptidase [Endothiovibrio diazotrophicus]
MLTQFDRLPEGLLDVTSEALCRRLPGPSLIHLAGRQERPLFVSVLLHGNEQTGLQAVQALLRKYAGRELPRALSIFVGNVAAAAQGHRLLEGQPDYNRVWPGGEGLDSPEGRMMAQVVEEMARRRPFASVDVHNNTGINPHYGCVNRLEPAYLHLANLFSRTVVYFLRPKGVSSMAMAELCPAVTVECGQPGQPHGRDHAADYLDGCLHLSAFPERHPVHHQDIDLFHTVATVKVPEEVRFTFGGAEGGAAIDFVRDLDHLNFRELPAGTFLGRLDGGRLEAWSEAGDEVARRYFDQRDGELRTRIPVMPSMFTLNEEVIRQDCLGYLMERYPLPSGVE